MSQTGAGHAIWTQCADESETDWTIISDLEAGFMYEIKVIARNGDTDDSPKTSSRIGRIWTGCSVHHCL